MVQGILGTTSKNPLFFIRHNVESKTISIFFGLVILTVIPNNKDSIIFKSTIAILLNAGVCSSHIEKEFDLSYKTVKKYGKIFNSSNDEELLRNDLKNPGREIYKVNDEVLLYIHERADFYKSENKIRFNQYIILDVKDEFDLDLSRDTIRLALKKERPEFETDTTRKDTSDNTSTKSGFDYKDIYKKDNLTSSFRNAYAGIYLLFQYISLVFIDFPDFKFPKNKYSVKNIFIWLCLGVLLGAKNLERMRHFNIKDFEYVSGYKGFPSIGKMRELLYEISLQDNTNLTTFFIKKNIDHFIEQSDDYYIDGHFEEYTGKSKILSGWHTIKNRVCKGVYDYFVHDGNGNPIFTVLQDTFVDFREVIKYLLIRIKELRKGKPVTLIYDRGGFSVALMEDICSLENQYFITWQKGFKQEDASQITFEKSVTIELPYNELGKFKSKKYLFYEDIWSYKELKCRRIIFEKIDDNNKKFHQSILTNSKEPDGGIILKKMLARTKQENDFKKQKNHFGLDEITNYKKLEYGELNDKKEEHQADNNDYKHKLKIIKELKKRRKILFEKIGVEIYKKSDLKKLNSELSKKNKENIDEVNELNIKIKSEEESLKSIKKKISKLEKCKKENYVELDLRAKRIFSIIKILSRNITESGAKYFLETYKNLRNYQNIFRKLICSGGEISIKNGVMYITLDSFGRDKFKQKCNDFFHEFNAKRIKTLDGKYIIQYKDFLK